MSARRSGLVEPRPVAEYEGQPALLTPYGVLHVIASVATESDKASGVDARRDGLVVAMSGRREPDGAFALESDGDDETGPPPLPSRWR